MLRREILEWNSDREGKAEVEEGDVVVVHSRFDEVRNVTVRKGEKFQNRYGLFGHDDVLGKVAGSRWVTSHDRVGTGAGFVLALRPTAELWTLSLAHRTQIVYLQDISVILMELELRPGCVVVEAGTGSGSMTASLARAVAPTGRVFSYEVDEDRTKRAEEDFKKLGINEFVTFTNRDVCADGFADIEDASVDAVFLDMPSVWQAIGEAERMLKSDGVLALFSPCVEQVQQSHEALKNHKFTQLKTITTRLRSWETRVRFVASKQLN